MQHSRSHPYPLPDVHPAWAQSRPSQPSQVLPSSNQDQHAPPLLPKPDFLIVGLFALRLTRRLIHCLEPYPERASDIEWLDNFLSPYHTSYDLAKVTDPIKKAYLQTYPHIVARMKAQRRYPLHFMALSTFNPQRREALSRQGGLTDGAVAERKEIIDFADAAGEWGSIVHIPHGEAKRMLELADQRRIADRERCQGVKYGYTAADKACMNVEHHV
ncbi:hypothetical protein SVAN01_06836 [Stagonosporopsis vannaccii]|nr:hypothetical protein SVAN01_06836 [Stagonosporopsis vannaccii]